MSDATVGVEAPPIYQVKDLVRVFTRSGNQFRALDRVSFQVATCERVGIVGESGSGKSTLVRILAALLRSTSGEVNFDGRSIVNQPDDQLAALRRDVQMVFQDPRSSLDPRMRVGDIITEPLRSPIWRGSATFDLQARLAEVMTQVGLDSAQARRYPHQFSGGQRQRIAIARAIVGKPRVLIADEAVSALDVSVRAQALNLLTDLVHEYGLTMLFVSHDLSVVRQICDTVMVLRAGRIVEYGSAEQIYQEPQARYTQQLLASVPRLRRG